MVVDMELQEAKDAIFELMKEKDKIESKLLELTKILDNVCVAYIFPRCYYRSVMFSIEMLSYRIIAESCRHERVSGGL